LIARWEKASQRKQSSLRTTIKKDLHCSSVSCYPGKLSPSHKGEIWGCNFQGETKVRDCPTEVPGDSRETFLRILGTEREGEKRGGSPKLKKEKLPI
jgi:hypothetical protein